MTMPRALFAATLALCAAATACGDATAPSNRLPDVFAGRWLLLTINGQALPAMNRILDRTMLAGRLTLPTTGLPSWEYCVDSASVKVPHNADMSLFDFDLTDGQAELWTLFPAASAQAVDTIVLSQDTLTWEYNLRSAPGGTVTDLFRLRRLAALEGVDPICSLAP